LGDVLPRAVFVFDTNGQCNDSSAAIPYDGPSSANSIPIADAATAAE
jgi:hypothetical protein